MRATFQLVIILQNVQISSQYITHLKLIQYYVSAKKKKKIFKNAYFEISAQEEMATHSSVLAWRIPGMGLHRVGHD